MQIISQLNIISELLLGGLAMLTERKTITFDELHFLQMTAFQVVVSLEMNSDTGDFEKRRLAYDYTASVMEEIHIPAPPSVIKGAIDSSLYSVRMATRRE